MESARISTIFPLYSCVRKQTAVLGAPPNLSLAFRDARSLLNLQKPRASISARRRNLSIVSEAGQSPPPSEKISESFFRSVLASMEGVYLNRNPSAKAILELVHSYAGDNICYDHFAFRTFGVDGHGIDSMARFFLDFGYKPREELKFPVKKLRARWFSPPDTSVRPNTHGVEGSLPRIFISELLVEEMSSEAQDVIRKYTSASSCGNRYAATASSTGSLTWGKATYADYQLLSRESEYAAWTLVNAYALNHVTISTHQLKSSIRDIANLNKFVEESGFKLNSEGGLLKVSPDELLLQSSTVADSMPFHFADGVTESVPCSYIEFAQRLVLPQYRDLPEDEALQLVADMIHPMAVYGILTQIKEFHRRDGFEVGNADKIFESTSKGQLSRKSA